ncbi:MAG: TolC family protein [Candidatus Methylomirabilia bacterium]
MRKIVSVLTLLPAIVSGLCAMALAAGPSPGGSLSLSIAEAVVGSLANNRSLEVQRIAPEIARTGELSAEAPFDTTIDGKLSGSSTRSPQGVDAALATSDAQRLTLGASRLFAPGTTLGVELDTSRSGSADSASTRVGVSLTQALLQGRGSDVNLAAVRQARLDTAFSLSELQGFTESLVAQVELASWDYLLAIRRIAIVESSLGIAETQFAEVRERIAVGRMAQIEQVAAEAEVALRREALINAKSARAASRLNLLRLINSPGTAALVRELTITDVPALPADDPAPVEDHVALALRRRPELAQARLQLERGDLELVQTRNGLLPRLDLFVSLGATGYAASFGDSLDVGDGHDITAGLTLRLPLGNSAARAADRRAVLSRRRTEISLENLAQLVEVDVRGAWIEAGRLREQVAATAATLRLQDEKLRAETEKFRVGKSTAFLVAQAQRDLLQAENDEVSAIVGLLKARVDCYRLEGTLLERRGITLADR